MNTAPAPLVSVCIPTYNRADRLRRAVDHLLAGTYPNLEIVISDNASTDATWNVCAELCSQHANIRYFRHPVNAGPTKNFEFARAQATGKYFLWHGDDDYLAVDFIARCVDELERDYSMVLVSGLAAYHRGDHVITHFGNVLQPNSDAGLKRVLYFILTVEEGSIFCGAYRRQEVIDCCAPNCLAGDHVWMAEVLLLGKAKVIPDTFVYREEWDNTSSSMKKMISTLGLPAWQGTFPWVAIPHNLAHGVAFSSSHYKQAWLPKKLLIYFVIYLVSFARQWMYAAALRVPHGRKIYRYIFNR